MNSLYYLTATLTLESSAIVAVVTAAAADVVVVAVSRPNLKFIKRARCERAVAKRKVGVNID